MLLTMPGVPFIYYGDEIGMNYVEDIDPKEGSFANHTGSRTPMRVQAVAIKDFLQPWLPSSTCRWTQAPKRQTWPSRMPILIRISTSCVRGFLCATSIPP